MLQIRLKEGGDRRWFNPARDITNCLPVIVRVGLRSFNDFEGVPGCSREELVETAQELGELFLWIIKEPVDHVMAQDRLKALMDKHPVAMRMVSDKFLHVLVGVYAAWIADTKPKTEDDAQIPTVGIADIMAQLAGNSCKSEHEKHALGGLLQALKQVWKRLRGRLSRRRPLT
jgi:hypothetical protein